jgi:Tfp pilus assembly protein PilO
VFEIIVVLVVVGAGWFYLSMNKNDTEGSAPGKSAQFERL